MQAKREYKKSINLKWRLKKSKNNSFFFWNGREVQVKYHFFIFVRTHYSQQRGNEHTLRKSLSRSIIVAKLSNPNQTV